MKLIIENTSGAYWTGSCWGVRQAAREYDGIDDLPEEIGDLELWTQPDAGEARYYPVDGAEADAEAVARRMRTA